MVQKQWKHADGTRELVPLHIWYKYKRMERRDDYFWHVLYEKYINPHTRKQVFNALRRQGIPKRIWYDWVIKKQKTIALNKNWENSVKKRLRKQYGRDVASIMLKFLGINSP